MATQKSNGSPEEGKSLLARLGFGVGGSNGDSQNGVEPGAQEKEDMAKVANDPRGYSPQYVSNLALYTARQWEQHRAVDNVEEAKFFLGIAGNLLNFIDTELPKRGNVIFPLLRMDEKTTEGGVLGIDIDPNREYLDDEIHWMLKRVESTDRGRQAFSDSRAIPSKVFQKAYGDEFRIEHIYASVPFEGQSFLLRRFVPGPDLSNLFYTLDEGIGRAREQDKAKDVQLLQDLESKISEIAAQKLIFWQEHAPDLILSAGNDETVRSYYIGKFVEIIEDFSTYAGLRLSDDDKAGFVTAVGNLDWSSIVDSEKTKRNLAATYKNIVLATGKITETYLDILEMFTKKTRSGRRIREDYLAQRLVFVDTPDKRTHLLEDAWEMDLTLEGRSKELAVPYLVNYYETEKGAKFTPFEQNLIGAYRAYRKAHLILTKFIPQVESMRDEISDAEYRMKQTQNYETIKHLLGQGEDLLREMRVPSSQQANFRRFKSTLFRLGNQLSHYKE